MSKVLGRSQRVFLVYVLTLKVKVTGQGHRLSKSFLELFVKLLHITCELYMLKRCGLALKKLQQIADKISRRYLN